MRKCWKVNLSYRWNHTAKFQRRLLSAVSNKNRLPPSQSLYVSQNIHTGRFKRQMENVMDWSILNNTGWGCMEIAFPSDIDNIVLWTSREIFHSSEGKQKGCAMTDVFVFLSLFTNEPECMDKTTVGEMTTAFLKLVTKCKNLCGIYFSFEFSSFLIFPTACSFLYNYQYSPFQLM